MKEVNTGLERAEKTVIRAIPGIETVEVVREMKVWRGIIETEIAEVIREMKVWKGIMEIKTEEVMPGTRAVTGVTMMIRITEKILGVSMESQVHPLI